jgi:metal iron transporter
MNFAKLDDEAQLRLELKLEPKETLISSTATDQKLKGNKTNLLEDGKRTTSGLETNNKQNLGTSTPLLLDEGDTPSLDLQLEKPTRFQRVKYVMGKYLRFIGPGLMVSISFIDPGNYSTAVAAGSALKYKLLFIVLLSNILAAFFQILAAKLGAVTGLDLSSNCRRHLPKSLNILVYIIAEIAIIATDITDLIGCAIALNILFNIPLLLGVLLTVIDVLFVLMAYRPGSSLKFIRLFEAFVGSFMILTVICFICLLFKVHIPNKSEVFQGFIPSGAVFKGDGLMLSMAICGASIMPHSLFLGSGVVQARLKDYDIKNGNYKQPEEEDINSLQSDYRPSISSIKDTMNYTVAELLFSLFTVALFVNSAILIVAGSTFFGQPEAHDADLFSIHQLLTDHLSNFAGLIFVLALLFSGESAAFTTTIAGQIVSEGHLHWSITPTVRRTITRCVAIVPCIMLVLISGRSGLSSALNASQVILSLLLPFVSAPLLYFTASSKIMRVRDDDICYEEVYHHELRNLNSDGSNETLRDDNELDNGEADLKYLDMSNSIATNVIAFLIWCLISGLNFYLLWNIAVGNEVAL